MSYTIVLTDEELAALLIALSSNRELQYKIKDQAWSQAKVSA
jgi:hypothetical protein